MKYFKIIIFIIIPILSLISNASEISLTIDDLTNKDSPIMTVLDRTDRILKVLNKHKIKASLFVCGKRIDSEEGKKLLNLWNKEGHDLGNHSYSHYYFPSSKVTIDMFKKDFFKGEQKISGYTQFKKIFRFPYLKHGNTIEKKRSN